MKNRRVPPPPGPRGGTGEEEPVMGITAWLAAAAHEIPQEPGDFGVLIHGGWSRGKPLMWTIRRLHGP